MSSGVSRESIRVLPDSDESIVPENRILYRKQQIAESRVL